MKELFTFKYWMSTPERRMLLMRIFYLISLGMLVLGFILIVFSLIFEDFFP